jgi:hypothetical protein
VRSARGYLIGAEFKVDFDVELNENGLSVECGGIKFILLNRMYGLVVVRVVHSAQDSNVLGFALLVDPEVNQNLAVRPTCLSFFENSGST